MIFPGVRRRSFHVPDSAIPVALGASAVCLTIAAWAIWSPSPAGLDNAFTAGARPNNMRSVAYTVPGPVTDDIVVRPAAGVGLPKVVATFPSSGLTNVHARGVASPLGEHIAVQWVPAFATVANLSVIDLSGPSPVIREAAGITIDPLSPIAWSHDGTRFAVLRTDRTANEESTTVLEIDLATLIATPIARYTGVLDVAPVGYSFDNQDLFVAVVDQKGSNLHSVGPGRSEIVAELSPGRTRDWSLSPDGARLAFIDILGGGSRTFVGRTLILATGQITTLPAERNQFGAAWLPGSPSPGFGGPGGDWQLTDPGAEGVVLVPNAWSPDGDYLVATLNTTVSGAGPAAPPVIELISRETATAQSVRVRISEASGAAFLGWVADLD